jgi:hypothetical protein
VRRGTIARPQRVTVQEISRGAAYARQHAFGRLNIGQLSGDLFAVGIEARQSLADLASPD